MTPESAIAPLNANQDLERLHEIVPPEAVAWTPQTIGWQILAALALVLAIWVLARVTRRWLRNRFRRQALAELGGLESQLGDPAGRLGAT